MIRFLKYTWIYVLISSIVIGAGLFSIIKYGYNYSIDFVGGTDLIYQTSKTIDIQVVKKLFAEKKIEISTVKQEQNQLIIRSMPVDEKQEAEIRNKTNTQLNTTLKLLKFETVGPVIGKETIYKTIIAAILAITGILIYMTFAFKRFDFALSAILAMVHDFLVVMGTYSIFCHIFGAQLDTMFVTAVLTSMSFSVHDTIVIFDKIREYFRLEGKGNLEFYADRALTETMVRSLNNSMTIIFMLLALTLLGGQTIKFFVATLLVGTITGSYSSPFVATPILVWLEKRAKKH